MLKKRSNTLSKISHILQVFNKFGLLEIFYCFFLFRFYNDKMILFCNTLIAELFPMMKQMFIKTNFFWEYILNVLYALDFQKRE